MLVTSFANIFSQSVGFLFILFLVSFDVQNLLSLVELYLFIFVFFHYSERWIKKTIAMIYINLDSILKSRDITLSTEVHLVKAMIFPVVMYGCESWTIKKAEHQRIDAFELWCWRRLLRVPWNARRSNQSILKEISPEYSLEGMVLKLKICYFGHLMQRIDSLEKILMLGKIEGRRMG